MNTALKMTGAENESLAEATSPVELMSAAQSLLAEFTKTVEAITQASEDGAVKKLSDSMAEILKAVAKKIEG
jgi:hypothetical protein